MQPRGPFHGGGPALKIDAHAYVIGALWLAQRASAFVDARDRKDFDRWVDLAQRQLELGADDNTHRVALVKADAGKVSRVPCKIGIWAAHEANNWARRPIYAGGAARPAAANFARFLAKKAPEQLLGYLKELDAYCIHLDALTSLREKKHTPSRAVEATLWRGHRDGKVLYWLMRLKGGKLALLYKEKTRWKLVEGARDDVLATVAEEHFEEAVKAAVGAQG